MKPITAISPLLGEAFAPDAYTPIDLSVASPGCQSGALHHFAGLEAYVQDHLDATGAAVAYGGYLEERCLYLKSPLFNRPGAVRSVHLGLDIWAPVGTTLYAPLPGRIWRARYNDGMLDYGATLILQHQQDGETFFTLYGHLSLTSLRRHNPGQYIPAGEAFAEIGPPGENGGWVPHVHVQLIAHLPDDNAGDFPGVCSHEDLPFYRAVCPDPKPLLGL